MHAALLPEIVNRLVYMTVPVPRQEMTGADRRWAAQYETGDIVGYTRGSQAVGVESGEYVQVTSAVRVQAREGRLVSVQWTKDRSNGAPETANNCKLPSPTRYFLQNLRQIDVNSGFSAGILSGFCSFSYTYRLRSYKKRILFSEIPERAQSAVFQNHLDFGLAKHLHQFPEQRVRGLFGGLGRPRRSYHRARRGMEQGEHEMAIETRRSPFPEAVHPRLDLAPRRARAGGLFRIAAVGFDPGGSHREGLAQRHGGT